MHEVWMICKPDGKDGYSYYAYMSGHAPEFVADKECAKRFRTKEKAETAFKEIGLFAVGSEIIKTKVQVL
jgi:hypothetical protein